MNNSVCFGGERSSHVIRHLTFLSSLLTHTSPLSWVMIACIPENKPSQVIWDGVRFWGAKSKNKIAKNKMRRIWNLLSNSKELTKFSFAIPNSKFRVNAFRSYCNPSRLLHQNRPGSSLSVLSQFFFYWKWVFIYLFAKIVVFFQVRLCSTEILLIKGSCNTILTKRVSLRSLRTC